MRSAAAHPSPQDYVASTRAIHMGVAATMSNLPLLRYAAPGTPQSLLDSGVLAIRDALLAMRATWYLSCPGRGKRRGSATCRRCFFSSRFLAAVQRGRSRAGRKSTLEPFDATVASLQPRPPRPRPLHAAARNVSAL